MGVVALLLLNKKFKNEELTNLEDGKEKIQ
jgi:hypothetical protein